MTDTVREHAVGHRVRVARVSEHGRSGTAGAPRKRHADWRRLGASPRGPRAHQVDEWPRGGIEDEDSRPGPVRLAHEELRRPAGSAQVESRWRCRSDAAGDLPRARPPGRRQAHRSLLSGAGAFNLAARLAASSCIGWRAKAAASRPTAATQDPATAGRAGRRAGRARRAPPMRASREPRCRARFRGLAVGRRRQAGDPARGRRGRLRRRREAGLPRPGSSRLRALPRLPRRRPRPRPGAVAARRRGTSRARCGTTRPTR